MMDPAFATISYEQQDRQVAWRGLSMKEGDSFNAFMTNDVASRLHDEEGRSDFEAHLRSLANTGFARDNLIDILAADIPEERDWAVGEAVAEAYLGREHTVTWPWSTERETSAIPRLVFQARIWWGSRSMETTFALQPRRGQDFHRRADAAKCDEWPHRHDPPD